MIKRTPQEWADFLGMFFAMDRELRWYFYEKKPEIVDGYWDGPSFNWLEIPFIAVDWTGNWKDSLHEPQKMHDKCTINAPVQLDNLDNKVCDYYIVHKYDIKSMLDKGWELYGNPFAIEGAVYQAMIRRENT